MLIEQPATQGQAGAANPPGFAHSCRLEEEFSLWEICDQELFRLPPPSNYSSIFGYNMDKRAICWTSRRLAPYETEPSVDAICESHRQAIAMEAVDPLILIPAFICDFLCIHPFNDGNGRMSRLLTVNVDLQSTNHEFGRADRHYDSALLSFSRKRRNSR